MVVRRTDVITLRGPSVSPPGGDPIPKSRRKDTKHIYLTGMGGAHKIRADVNAETPLPVYEAPAEVTMAEGGMFAEYSHTSAGVKKLSQDFDASRPR